jgi:hypothetical protein
MKHPFALTVTAIVALSSVGCVNRHMRNFMHRGAPCGATTAPATLPVVSDVTTYSPTCGWADPNCANCGTASGQPIVIDGGYQLEGTTPIMPEPGL